MLVSLLKSNAYAFPELQRSGYQTCQSCHVSPSGGGALTPYGRALSAELLSTWSYEGEGDLGHRPWMPEWLAIGGDLRYVNIKTQYKDSPALYQAIPMQKDIELGLNCGPFWLVGSYGEYYGAIPVRESRRHYLLVTDPSGHSLRFGKFTPNYGINHPDHRASNRGALPLVQGSESYNLELNVNLKVAQLTLTGILGDDKSAVYIDERLTIATEARQGGALRIAGFAHKSATIGASWMLTHQDYKDLVYTSGVFAILSPTEWAYAMIDYNFQETAETGRATMWAKVGLEAFRGFHVFYQTNMIDEIVRNGLGIIWFPRPHFEFMGMAEFSEQVTSYLLLTHYYL